MSPPPFPTPLGDLAQPEGLLAAATAHWVGGGERRRSDPGSHAPRTRPTHAHAHGQTPQARALPHPCSYSLHAPRRARARSYTSSYAQTDRSTRSRSHTRCSHPPALTHLASFAPSCIHSHTPVSHSPAYNLHSSSHTPTLLSCIHITRAHATNTRTLHLRHTHPVTRCHTVTYAPVFNSHAHFTRACAHGLTANSPSLHARAHAHLSRRGPRAQRGGCGVFGV